MVTIINENTFKNNLLIDPGVKQCLWPFQIFIKFDINNSNDVWGCYYAKWNEKEIDMTIVVKSKHLKDIRQYISIVKTTHSNGNPDEQSKHLQVPKVTSFYLWISFILKSNKTLLENNSLDNHRKYLLFQEKMLHGDFFHSGTKNNFHIQSIGDSKVKNTNIEFVQTFAFAYFKTFSNSFTKSFLSWTWRMSNISVIIPLLNSFGKLSSKIDLKCSQFESGPIFSAKLIAFGCCEELYLDNFVKWEQFFMQHNKVVTKSYLRLLWLECPISKFKFFLCMIKSWNTFRENWEHGVFRHHNSAKYSKYVD